MENCHRLRNAHSGDVRQAVPLLLLKKYYFLQRNRQHGGCYVRYRTIEYRLTCANGAHRPGAVERGEYASTSEVIRDALRFYARRQLREYDLEILRQRWDEGKLSGRAGPLDIQGLIAAEREKLEAPEDGRD